ncbi:MAG: WYL domain-containing protein [Thiohalorhabdus sp.]|uniref:helix-turn-helix transcriptional regulator n=1 Tax=Thiohalorhabdus sp. TaxID=3094134 RepID=UPI002FC2B57D
MRKSTDAIYRQWVVLGKVPQQPQSRATSELHDALKAEGLEVDRRTLQRDLERLSTLFPLVSESEGPGLRWSWLKTGAMQEIPAMSPSTALTFQLARDHLEGLFPPSLMEVLGPYFDRSEAVLGESHLGHWRAKVRLVDSGPALGTPEVSADVRDRVYQALLEERQLEAGYYSRSRDSYDRRRIHPLGLVGRDGVYYLVARVDDKPEARQLALHRMDSPSVLDEAVQPPADFDLDHYLEDQAAFSYPRNSDELALVMRVTREVAFHLQERPLTSDQAMEFRSDGSAEVSANVPDTEALRWWVLGFGPNVQVIQPEALRAEVGRLTNETAGLYGGGV